MEVVTIALIIILGLLIVWLALIGSATSLRLTTEQLSRAVLELANMWHKIARLAIETGREQGRAELWYDQAQVAIAGRRFFYHLFPDDKVDPLSGQNDPRGGGT